MSDLFQPLPFARGRAMKNRFALAPLTNLQSHADGVLSDDELRWLRMRAQGGFGLVMTCAAHVQAIGQGFPGQLGVWDDRHGPGLARLAAAVKAEGALAWMQLHHAGMRAPADLIGQTPVSASDTAGDAPARGLSAAEVEQLADSFIAAAVRAEKAGFDGVELHGAHGYILAQFLSPDINQRTDVWGGSLDNRARLLRTIIAGIRAQCGTAFQLGVRLSPERFGLRLHEMVALAGTLMACGDLDMLDISLWDYRKRPDSAGPEDGQSLLSHFANLSRGQTRLGGAGKIMSAADARAAQDAGLDFVMLGRAAILHHDAPKRIWMDPQFTPATLPVSAAHLRGEGLGPTFLDYMRTWKGFVAD
jgi:2,4-dienoyl-CoA reductase-like NADH-dependent reductase (Old Yellow Enzyme family)